MVDAPTNLPDDDAPDALDAPDPNDAWLNRVVRGRALEATDDAVAYDLGDGVRVLVPSTEHASAPEAGSEASILVEDVGPRGLLGSIWKANALALYDGLRDLARQQGRVEGTVIAANDGGLVVDVDGLRGFVPLSQIDLHKVDDVASYVGLRSSFAVLDFDARRGDLVISRRRVLETEQEARGKALASEIEVGKVFDGVVRRVVPYGAFVDLGGLEGLLHVSNMSWARIDNPATFVSVGQTLQVQVLEYDPQRNRIALGHKQLQPDPWADLETRFPVGSTARGRVVSLARYGAFVELAPGVEGLVHNTELSWTENVRHPKQRVAVGQELEVKILEIDRETQRLRLSVRALEENPWAAYAAEHAIGSHVSGTVARFADFGVFVSLAPGLDGLLHVNDISWTERVEDPSQRFEVGQTLELVLLSLDVEQGRASLGLKQLTDDPWTAAEKLAQPGTKLEVEIVRLVPFGAFARIADGVEGLIHISEMREERVDDPSQVVSVGKRVEALVLVFDRKKQRISLSLKRDELPEASEGPETYTDDGEARTSMADLLRRED